MPTHKALPVVGTATMRRIAMRGRRRAVLALAGLGLPTVGCGDTEMAPAFGDRPRPVAIDAVNALEAPRNSAAPAMPALRLTHLAPPPSGHTSWVHAVAWSPDGSSLATAGLDGLVKIWAVATSRERISLRGHRRSTLSVAWSPDSTLLASGEEGNGFRLWRAADGTTLAAVEDLTQAVHALVFTRDGSRLLVGRTDGSVVPWEVAALAAGKVESGQGSRQGSGRTSSQGAILASQSQSIRAAAVSPNGRLLVAAAGDGVVAWDLATGAALPAFPRQKEAVNALAFSPSGDAVAVALMARSPQVVVWDVATRAVRAELAEAGEPAYAVAFSPDGRLLAVGMPGGMVALRDAGTLRLVRTLQTDPVSIYSVAFSPDGARLAAPSGAHSAAVWDVQSGRRVAQLRGHFSGIQAVAFSSDGSTLAGGTRDSRIFLWDRAGGGIAPRGELRGHGAPAHDALSPAGVTALGFAGEENGSVGVLASGGADGTVRLWELSHAGASSQRSVAMSAAPSTAAVAPSGHIAPAAQVAARQVATFVAHRRWIGSAPVNALAWSPRFPRGPHAPAGGDSQLVGSVTADGVARVWNARTRRLVTEVRGEDYLGTPMPFMGVAASPDARILATVGGVNPLGMPPRLRLKLWRLPDGKPLQTMGDVATGQNAALAPIAFTRDGAAVVCPEDGGALALWDVVTGGRLATYTGHTAGLYSLTFSPDGTLLATAAGDGTVRLWDVASGAGLCRAEPPDTLGIRCVAFSPDGGTLVGGREDGGLLLWRVNT